MTPTDRIGLVLAFILAVAFLTVGIVFDRPVDYRQTPVASHP